MYTEKQLLEHLKDRWWRLNNLYWIKPKQGRSSELVLFQPNWAQKELYDKLWYRNTILKARQLGVTTYWSIFFLDDCIFNANREAGIIADTRENAEEIFRTKVKGVWDNIALDMPFLRAKIKESNELQSDQGKRLVWQNGSAFRVGTSMRSGTLTELLITEYGKICAKEPDKAREVRTGSIETLPKDALLVIESTAMGNDGDFYQKCMDAKLAESAQKELSSLDYSFFFFPWWKEKAYRIDLEEVITKEFEDYFNKLKESDIELDEAQKSWYIKKNRELGDDMKREYPSTPEEAFEQSIEGAYFTREIAECYKDQRIGQVSLIENQPVYTGWDLGVNDTTCIVFFQILRGDIRIFDFYENSDEGMLHYIKYIKNKDYLVDKNFAPWDIEKRDFSLGKSRKEFARELGFYFDTVRRVSDIMDKIEVSRLMFSRIHIDEKRCSGLIKALQSFRKEWDDKRGCYKNRPLHDWASNPFDAFATAMKAIDEGMINNNRKQMYAEENYNLFTGEVYGEYRTLN